MRNKIEYSGHTFTPTDIKSVNIRLASGLISRKLEANTLTAVVETDDDSIRYFARNTPMRYFHKDRQRFIAYVQTVDRVGPRAYQIYGTSAIGLLIERLHVGGIYTGQTAEAVIREIAGPIPFVIKNTLRGVKLYGWLPYAKPPERSARDNLVQVLFAIGAALKTDLDGVLHIDPLWDGISGVIGWEKIYQGASIKRDGTVSAVSVTEHNYIAGTEEKKLFEGDAVAGDIITFSEPMHSLAATGFSILERGANYAKLSAGTGTLTGKAYIHNTRQITRTVNPGAPENVETVNDATLISFFNSNAAADRLTDYYRQQERINCDVVLGDQSPGDVLDMYHPYDKTNGPACVESLDITASGILKARVSALVGYRPRQVTDVEYFDRREMFTSSTTFTVPEGVHNIRAVLIGGGQGGQGGRNGGAGGTGGTAESRSASGTVNGAAGTAGSGGAAGAGGSGGKFAIFDIAVEPGQVVTISIGNGGSGGSSGGSGSAGGNTTITVNGVTYSSASGTSTASGYTDTQTGEVFARPGSSGTAGGKGGAGGSGYNSRGSNGVSVGGYSGGAGGTQFQYVNERTDSYNGNITSVEFIRAPCGGGGAAIGAAGGNATRGSDSRDPVVSGKGANASGSGFMFSTIGSGGGGGNGGGGGGGGGGGIIIKSIFGGSGVARADTLSGASGGSGGSGSRGGTGRSGGAIFYFAEAKEAPSGSPMDKNGKLILDKFGRTLVM